MKQAPVKIGIYGKPDPMAKAWREWFSDLFISAKSLRLPARKTNPSIVTGEAVIWLSDGTGDGDDGDVMISVTNVSGVTKTTTLVDFSTL